MADINIYQMYIQNNCRFGFYVKKDNWRDDRYTKVVSIEFVTEGKMIKGKPPYFGGFINPPGHPRAGKIMGPRMVRLEADWFDEKFYNVNGGTWNWSQVYPKNPEF